MSMEKQSNKNQTPDSELEKRWNNTEDQDEITVKKTSPLADSETELNSMAEEDMAQDYKSLYEDTLAELQKEKEEALRKLAEVENFRKRLLKEKEELVKYANEALLQELFPCLDNLDMTLTHATPEQIQKDPVISGVNLVLRQFLQTLQKHALEDVGREGEVFDPHLHEAIDSKPVQGVPPGQVVKVHRKGYKLHGRLLRAALVSVSA